MYLQQHVLLVCVEVFELVLLGDREIRIGDQVVVIIVELRVLAKELLAMGATVGEPDPRDEIVRLQDNKPRHGHEAVETLAVSDPFDAGTDGADSADAPCGDTALAVVFTAGGWRKELAV